MMSSRESKYPFFQKLRKLASTVSKDVKEIEAKLHTSTFELPENNAMLQLSHIRDEMSDYKKMSHDMYQQICEENKKRARYRVDIDCLAVEMEGAIDKIEDQLTAYGYKRWNPEQESELNCSSPSKSTHPAEEETQGECGFDRNEDSTLPNTPVLADYGLTTKIPKYFPSALKDKQSMHVSTKKQVHFESPVDRNTDKGKENKVLFSLSKTPLLEDYGLPSRSRSKIIFQGSHMKDDGTKKQLNFRSPLSSVSENYAQGDLTEPLTSAEIDNSENFLELVSSFPKVVSKNPSFQPGITAPRLGMSTTPQAPKCLSSQRKIPAVYESETGTPEEPEIQPILSLKVNLNKDISGTPEEPQLTPLRHPIERKSGTPEVPIATPLLYASMEKSGTPEEPVVDPVFGCKSMTPNTPQDLELEVTSSFKEWLQLRKKR